MSTKNTGFYRVTFKDGFTYYLRSYWGGYAWEVAQGLFPNNPVRNVESVKHHTEIKDFLRLRQSNDAAIASTGEV